MSTTSINKTITGVTPRGITLTALARLDTGAAVPITGGGAFTPSGGVWTYAVTDPVTPAHGYAYSYTVNLPGGGSVSASGLAAVPSAAHVAGADPVTVTITDGTRPVADANVWVSSDAAGTQVVAGTLRTNTAGQTQFLLTAGLTYYLWMQKDGVNSILGQSFVAVHD